MACALATIILLIDYQIVLQGIREGLLTCAKIVVPSLFMTCVFSCVLMSSPYSENLLTNSLAYVFGFNRRAGVCVFFGLWAGFPSAAAGAYELYNNGYVTQKECEKSVYFTNNAGLAFILGTVGTLMGDMKYALVLWGAQTLSSLTLANVFRSQIIYTEESNTFLKEQKSLVEAVKKGAGAMITVCAFVCFFTASRLLVEDILRKYIQNEMFFSFISSFLEIGNAVTCASRLSRFSKILCSFSVGFGGICAILQSVAVCPCVKISKYIAARVAMGLLCVGYVWLIDMVIK